MPKFAIDAGHGLYPDTGAEGYLNEQNCALDIASSVISKLQSLGHEAWNVRPSSASSVTDSLQQRCDSSSNADYLVSIHLNAGGGKGTEIFATGSTGNVLASNVLKSLVALGFVNRGVKDGSGLYVIRHSNPIAILIEVCFVDTQSDVDLYNQLGVDEIANAIIKGITGKKVETTQTNNVDLIKAVQHDLQKVSCLAPGEIIATGVLDNRTKEAIRNFKNIVGLADNCELDDTVISALNDITSKSIIGRGWPSNPIATKFIQWWFGLSKTGIFDESTERKVKEWQITTGIWSAYGADGVLREKDWGYILK